MKRAIILLSAILLLSSCTQSGSPQNNASGEAMIPGKVLTTPTRGSGKHTLTVYADFQCPACIWYNKNIITPVILKEFVDTGKLTISYKQFPLKMHQNAEGDSLAVLCGHEQGKFFEYKEAMYNLEDIRKGDDVKDIDRIQLAKNLGLNEQSFKQCLTEKRYSKHIEQDMSDGNAIGLRGTPTFVVDGKMVDNQAFMTAEQTRIFLNNITK